MSKDQSQPARTWWPEFLMDESMPAGKAHPTEWILWNGSAEAGNALAFMVGKPAAADDDDDGYPVAWAIAFALDACVDFTWSEPRGHREVTVYPDGTYRVEGEEPSDFTNCWELGEPESCADTLDAFAREFASNASLSGAPEVITVHFIKWGDEPFRLQLVDGAPAFVPVGAGGTP